MGRKYTKGEELSDAIRARNAAGETNRAIGESYGLSKRQVEQLISRQNRKGRPRKEAASEEVRQHNELAKLRMQVELLQNFPSEAEMSSYRTIPRKIQCRSHARGLRGESKRVLCMAKAAGTGCEGPVAGRADCGMPEKVQTDLRHSPRSALDPAPGRKKREPQGDSTPDAKAESAVRRSPPPALYPLSAGCA